MKILYDHQTFYQKIGGVSRYFVELVIGLKRLECVIAVSCYFSNNIYLSEVVPVKKIFPRFNLFKIIVLTQVINKYFTIRRLKKQDYDIFHATQYSPYFIKHVKKKIVITIHDMVSELFDNNARNSKNKRIIIPIADAIIAISQNTKKDILKLYPELSPNKITVIHHGVNQIRFDVIPNKFGNYILYVGGRDGYKNFDNFFTAIAPLLKNDKTFNLVCTGSPFNEIELSKFKEAHVKSQCYSVLASDVELFSLYKHAKVFVFPSFYEGFGLPILEAFVSECPICISHASCFPEIAGDAAMYFDPSSTKSIAKSIEKVIYDPALSNFLRDRGRERVKDFSWEKSAKLHFELYKSLLEQEGSFI